MGKRSRARKRALLASKANGYVSGGLEGALFRGYNGQATPDDIDFLSRMRRESKGKDGYTGMAHSKSSFSGTADKRFTFYQAKDEAVFHCAESNEITDKCPLNPDVPVILIPITMWECFLACCKEYDTEWIALLIGKLGKDSENKDAYIIDKFYFPPQTASGAHVDVPTGVKPKPGTIGAIHSHVNMRVFWSGTDTAHSNWPVEIVINRKEQYESLSRYQLKCGEWAKGKSEVRLTGSYVSKAINSQVQAAFQVGETLDKANKAAIATRATVYTPPVPIILTTTQHHPLSMDSVQPSCKNCNHFSHKKGEKCPAMQCLCDATTYKEEVGTKTERLCSVVRCVRAEGHPGYHMDCDNHYFTLKDVNDQPLSQQSDHQQSQITWPYPEQLAAAKDDPTIEGELPAEEYCQTCEGYGFVSKDGKPATEVSEDIADCPSCKGTGLSEIGKVRAAESMLH